MPAYETIVGDRRTPIGAVLIQGGRPVDLSSATVTFSMYDKAGTAKVSAQSATAHPTVSFTAATTDIITSNGHKAVNGDQVVLSSTGTLPAGLAASTRYFVIQAQPNTFQVATVPNGAPVDITDTGSGTHSFYIVGSVQYSFAAADVDTAGEYEGYWLVTEGGVVSTFPANDHGQSIYIKAKAVVG